MLISYVREHKRVKRLCPYMYVCLCRKKQLFTVVSFKSRHEVTSKTQFSKSILQKVPTKLGKSFVECYSRSLLIQTLRPLALKICLDTVSVKSE